MRQLKIGLMCAMLALGLAACQEKDALRISEEGQNRGKIVGSMPSMLGAFGSEGIIDSSVKFSLPPHWKVIRGSGIRLATFSYEDDTNQIATLTFIPGTAGDESANLKRWLKQVHVQLATDEFRDFVKTSTEIQTNQGWHGRLYDFSRAPIPAGLAVVVFHMPKGTYFLKMSLDLDHFKLLNANFISLASSMGGSLD